MVKKKGKTAKKGRKRGTKEDVKYSTSLPPAVEGQLRCFLRVSVTKIDWMVAKPPDVTHVRLHWWGEFSEDGTVFRPLDMRNPEKSTSRTTARFPVRCGPKQFTAYLSDMGVVALEVLKGTSMIPVGKVDINEIGHLTPQNTINGFFPVFSNKDRAKIGELHVSMAFEPLPSSYDSSSSMPTTDVSLATGSVVEFSHPRRHQGAPLSDAPQPEPHPQHRKVATFDDIDGLHVTPLKQQNIGDKRIQTPRGVDSDYSFVVGPGADRKTLSHGSDAMHVTEAPRIGDDIVAKYHSAIDPRRYQRDSDLDIISKIKSHQQTPAPSHHHINPTSKTGQDLITALLGRGTKLRDAMVVSEIPQQRSVETGGNNADPNLKEKAPRKLRRSSSGDLFREILDVDDRECQSIVAVHDARHGADNEESFNAELNAVELLVGDELSKKELNNLKALQSGRSPASSVSSHSDDGGVMSELEDPVHDTSILEELFYNGLRSSSDDNLSDLLSSDSEGEKQKKKVKKKGRRRSITPDINDPGNRRPSSRRSSSSRRESISTATTPPTSDRPLLDQQRRGASDTETSHHIGKHRHISRSSGGEGMSSDSESGSVSRMSDGSRVSFDGPQDEEIKVSPSDGLSVERLTLLGKVHIARVMVDTLSLDSMDDASVAEISNVRSNRASRIRGKPPRPAIPRTKKKSYFVEYQFPVVASSRDKSLVNTMATEVMRLVSKKITHAGAHFGHRSVFPVSFNGTAVDRWWKQMVVFKVFSRTQGQKTPTFLGVSSVRLRDVLHSTDLAVHKELPVKDKSTSRRHSQSSRSSAEDEGTSLSDASVIGKLKVTIELGSDNKDFSMALARTKLAEMRGAKIVPLPSDHAVLPIKIKTTNSSGAASSEQKRHNTLGVQTESDRPETSKPTKTVSHQGREKPSRQDSNQQESPPVVMNHKGRSEEEEVLSGQCDEDTGYSKQQVRYHDGRAGAAQQVVGNIHDEEYEGLTLHSLLLIPDGRGITIQGVKPVTRSANSPRQPAQPTARASTGWSGWGQDRDRTTRNTYLVCRMFWSDDSVRSDVCWGTSEPNYSFKQVAPVLLTSSLLERTRNNVMVIEVWDKKTSAQNDELVGMAKVSLHQFYMSFRDRRIANTLLKSQYPVVAVDDHINVTDPLSGVQYGQIKVLLALGSMEQVSALQRLKCDTDVIADVRPERPLHYLERGKSTSENRDTSNNSSDMVEHVFEVIVEGIRGMNQLEDTYWGEADCFVQYHFPTQPQQQEIIPGKPTQAGAPILKPHRTATTLCVPDPTFHDVTRHRIILPHGIPAQRELLTACAGVGGGSGGIPFEVWCRYYYPNIRDQVAAKSLLPLAKLCAMVTMQRRGEPSVQTFSLPLKMQHVEDEDLTPEQKAKMKDAGLLDVTISYSTATVQQSSMHGTSASDPVSGTPHVCLSVGVLRACGLKMAASHLARFDNGMQYASEVGTNTYVKMELSFLAKEEMRITRTIARTFAPEFSHHVDFPSPLLLSHGDNDTISLAETLESAEMKIQVWHQTPGFRPGETGTDYRQLDHGSSSTGAISGRQLVPGSVDVLLGTATMPLHTLLTHRTGIQGWIPLTIPSQGWSATRPDKSPDATTHHKGLERIGGGLEMSIKFAHPNDREKVVNAARRVGWAPNGIVDDEEICEQDSDANMCLFSEVAVHVDAAWFPDYTALRPGQDTMDSQAKAYLRYKFYDKAALCSKLCYLDISEDGHIKADFKHAQCFKAAHTQPFAWYLREEQLEIQLWVSYNQDHPPGQDLPRPQHRDKLVGCAYVDLSPLTDKRTKHHRVSGLYPVFKPGASNLGGACLRIHINMNTSHRKQTDGQQAIDDTDEISLLTDTGKHPHHRADRQQPQRHADELDKQKRVENWLQEEQEMEEQRKAEEDETRKKAKEEQEEEARRNRPVLMKVFVERAMHLPNVQDVKGLQTCAPSCYITYQSADDPSTIQSHTVPSSAQPAWGFEAPVKVSKEVLENQCFILKLWHQTGSVADPGSDRVLGFCSIDMGPLLAGFRSLNGWYNIMDFSGQCHGQIKVCITPCESLSPLKRTPKHRTLTMSPNTSSVFVPGVSYVISHPAPLERRRHVEKHHHTSEATYTTEANTAPASGPLTATAHSHFENHLKNIRKFHQDLQDRVKIHHPELEAERRKDGRRTEDGGGIGNVLAFPETSVASSVTTSFLVKNLRKNLQELDIVHQKFQQRLVSPEIPTQQRNENGETRSTGSYSSSNVPTRKTIDHHETRTVGLHIENASSQEGDDKGDLSSENNSIEIDTNNKRRSLEDLGHRHIGVEEEQYQDKRNYPLAGRLSPSQMSDNWEDSVQFGDVVTSGRYQDGYQDAQQHQDGDQEMQHHQYDHDHGDPEDDDDDFVVIPKALNNVSSANFVNVLRMDDEGGVSGGVGNADYREHDSVTVRHGELVRDVERTDVNEDHDVIGEEVHNNQDSGSNPGDAQRLLDRTFSVSEESSDSLEGRHHPSSHQEQQNFQEIHKSKQISEKDRNRILADATNHFHPSGFHNRDSDNLAKNGDCQTNPTSSLSTGHPDIMDAERETVQQNMPSENQDPIVDAACYSAEQSANSNNDNNPLNPIREFSTGYDSLPRHVPIGYSQGETFNEPRKEHIEGQTKGDSHGQRSLSWSSEDSIVLTLDPQVAHKQQTHMEQRRPAVPVDRLSTIPTRDPVPNFFLPPQDLEASMRALHSAVTFLPRSQPREGAPVNTDSSERSYQRSQAAQEVATRLGAVNSMTTHQPTAGGSFTKKPKLKVPSAEEAKRIAKIFGSKYSGPF